MILLTFNYLAIIAASIVSVGLGGLYVNVFKKQWAKFNGFENADALKSKTNYKTLAGIFLANVAMAFGLSFFIIVLGIISVAGAVLVTFWVFAGFVLPLTLGPVLWDNKPIKSWIFNNIINLICLFAMVIILTFWN